jgi:hypothetical protein
MMQTLSRNREHPLVLVDDQIRALQSGPMTTQIRLPIAFPSRVWQHEPWLGEDGQPERVIYTAGSGQYPGGNPNFTGDQPPRAIVSCKDTAQYAYCPLGIQGDRLWVKEAWSGNGSDATWYKVGQANPGMASTHWQPAIMMPRSAARYVLDVTAVRVQRLHAMTATDAFVEGIGVFGGRTPCNEDESLTPAMRSYRAWWNAQNARHRRPGTIWDRNPWTWVVNFNLLA